MATRKKATGGMPAPRRGREVPRPFAFHWGGGSIIEEAAFRGEHTEPAIQLLEYEGHPGAYGVRFCYYSLDGRFQRSPMMIDSGDTLEGLRASLQRAPKLRALLKRLVN
ncbi:MAG TPA: hypothetical protein VET66_10450 [Steroidobacteraceae bacterium]|nr:hypothetical protein [Dehalococcoidia bacterium]HYM28561.1 hypothetical protein [Steroidobacteraceae bacterium]